MIDRNFMLMLKAQWAKGNFVCVGLDPKELGERGHGLRKIMRAKQNLTYTVNHLPETLPIFDFIQTAGNVTLREMYATFNMGIGFVLFVPRGSAPRMRDIAIETESHFGVHYLGSVREGEKKVVLGPVGLTFDESDLDL
ncbi:hypothetical protein KW783_02425 [Candidatus Parcubacteria bacterium]|nr:hypothetical protein [Candidatus Parcubacteria bacterium]